jgi:hypothetical protein
MMWHATSLLMTATLASLGTPSSFLVGPVVLVPRTPKAHRQGLLSPLRASLKDYDQIGRLKFMHLPVQRNLQLAPPVTFEALIKWTTEHHSFTDVWVVSHGWRTSRSEALNKNYLPLFRFFDQAIGNHAPDKEIGIIGVTWPSRIFDFWSRSLFPADTPNEEVNEVVKFIQELQQDFPEKASSLIDASSAVMVLGNPEATNEDLVQARLKFDEALMNALSSEDGEEQWDKFGLFTKSPFFASGSISESGPPLDLVYARGRVFQFSFHTKMVLAAKTGAVAIAPALAELKAKRPALRLHLVGHSFGALLVASAANDMAQRSQKASSLTLLQGAFSHNSFAENFMFRDVLEKDALAGPFVVTHTWKDNVLKGTGPFCYNTAARNAQEDGTTFPSLQRISDVKDGGPNDKFGAIGANGALGLKEGATSLTMLPLSNPASYTLDRDKVNNLEATKVVKDHSDVWTAEVANLLVKVLNVT